jgi:hypothetical protein
MPDIKISQLNEMPSADLSDSDILVINDVSVSTTKSITFGNLLSDFSKNVVDSASGAKCTGDFTVDNELIVGGDFTTTATMNVADINADSVKCANALDTQIIKNTETTSVVFENNIKLADNLEIRVGESNDMKLRHDGTNSIVEELGTGSLIVQANTGVAIRNATSGKNFLTTNRTGTNGGKIRLWWQKDSDADGTHDGEHYLRFETDPKGLDIYGQVDWYNVDNDENKGQLFNVHDSSGTAQWFAGLSQDNIAGVGNSISMVMGFGAAAFAFKVDSDAITPALGYSNQASTISGADGGTNLGSTLVRWGDINMKEHLNIFNGTAPSASVAEGVILYAEDVASSSELKVRDEAGNVTTLSPHNFELIPQGPSEDMAWSYYSEKDGKRINVDMLKAIRVLERLSGEQLVFED